MNKLDQKKFDELNHKWQEETAFMSSAANMVRHPAYQEIVSHRMDAVPYIIKDMKVHNTYFWWHALYDILGEGPYIPPYAKGKLKCIQQMWLTWYEHHFETEPHLRG